MKKNLIIVIILVLILVSCKKHELNIDTIKPNYRAITRCVPLNSSFKDAWKWKMIKNPNQSWQVLNLGVFQDIVINDSVMYYVALPSINHYWTNLSCSIVQGIYGSDDVRININQDTMLMIAVHDGTQWKLLRN